MFMYRQIENKMKIFFLIFLCLFTEQNIIAQDSWIMRDSVGGPGKCAVATFVIGRKAYLGMGNSNEGFKRSIYEYDPIVDDWDKMESLGNASGGGLERASPASFALNGKGYVGLGNGNNPYYRDFWQYDPITDSWAQVADYGGTGRRQTVSFTIDSLAYVGTGLDASGYTSDIWAYNPNSNSWSQIADFGGGIRKQAVAFTLGSEAYVGTGDNGGFCKDFWKYNPITNSWSSVADFPGTARYAATGIGAYPEAIVGLGYDNTLNYTADLYKYNASNNSWIQLQDFPGGARSNAGGFIIENHAYIGCGYTPAGEFVDDFYEYATLVNTDKISAVSETEMKIFPNPVFDILTIHLKSLSTDEFQIKLYDQLGRCLNNNSIDGRGLENISLDLNISNFKSGLYHLQLLSGHKILENQSFIKQ